MRFEPSKNISWLDIPVNSINAKIYLHPVAVSGDHYIQVSLFWKQPGSPREVTRNLVTFKAIAQETMLGWTIGIIVGIGAIIVGILNLV